MAADSYNEPGYYSPSKDWVGSRRPGDLSVEELYSVVEHLNVEAAYDSFRADREARDRAARLR